MGHFERKFQRKGIVYQRLLTAENWAITWRCLRDPTFSRFDTIPACDRQTDTQTADTR